MSYEEDQVFEDEVRRIARAKWPQAAYSGAAVVHGRERDGIFETDDVIHYIEATTSRRADKVRDDTKKLFGLMSQQMRSGTMKGAIGWLVTRDEPTADQRNEVRQYGKQQVKICSFSQFQQSIVDVANYLSLREKHFFGSVLDPETRSLNPTVEYIPLDLADTASGRLLPVGDIVEGVCTGQTFVLLGDYGAGKSMTLRHIYFELKRRYTSGGTALFPVYINLREHSGQDDPSELLERHARRIGFEKPHSLVSAWRAGFALLILDGFDEITTLGVTGFRTQLRTTRRRSLEAVRRLIEQTPHSVGTVIAGREHFFNTPEERTSALALPSNTVTLTLNEFTADQIKKYLANAKGDTAQALPNWIPGRPLLVSYMASRGLISELQKLGTSVDPVDGWDALLDVVFSRESRISANLEGTTLRKILERLASVARSTPDGLGPITPQQIRNAFIEICGTEPDEQSNLLLQRLPGLGVYRAEEDSRTFVDLELAGVCRARDLHDYIVNPYGILQDLGWSQAMSAAGSFVGDTAIERVARDLRGEQDFAPGKLEAALAALDQIENKTLGADVVAVCIAVGHAPEHIVNVDDAYYENYALRFFEGMPDLSRVHFRNCLFERIEFDGTVKSACLPRLIGCIVATIHGRASIADLPDKFADDKCSFESFSDAARTQAEILGSSLSKGEKIVLALVRKLFIQSLSGRADSALARGLDLNDRQLVPDAVRLLQQHGFVTLYNRGDGNVWIPVRKNLSRARRMLSGPSTCGEKVLEAARALAH